MPSLGADMEAGTLVEWHVRKGAHVARGDVVALVETEKGVIEVEIWDSGIVTELRVEPGTKVPVGTVLAVVADENAPKPLAPQPSRAEGAGAAMPAPIRASPAARQLAREQNIDLATLHGTGPHEAVTRGDIERAVARRQATATKADARVVDGPSAQRVDSAGPAAFTPAAEAPSAAFGGEAANARTTGMRRAIAAAMARSKREIPHYYLSTNLDLSRATRFLEHENARRAVTDRILLAALFLKATALALRDVPELNGFYVGDAFRPGGGIHVGVAIALRQGGLVAPALHDLDAKPLGAVMAGLQDLVARARAGALKSSEVSEPTITVTSLGDRGSDAVFGVIYPPQVAIVGFGTVRERAWAEGGMLGVRPVVTVSLAADHRVSDGHRGARFLAAIGHSLLEPEKL